MLVSEILNDTILKFRDIEISTHVLDAEVIVSHALNCERYVLISDNRREISEDDLRLIRRLVKRRLKGEPVAYITGKKEFYSLDFNVDKNVFIPRPETELLVDLAIYYAKQDADILDLGTGSGAIAVSVKYNRSDCTVCASDISEKALKVAKRNAGRLLKRNAVKFFHGNIFSPFSGQRFDIIVSNPPYINPECRDTIQREITFEPEIALYADNGMDVINRVVGDGKDYLNEDGLIILEVGEEMKGVALKIGEESGYSVSVLSDYAGLTRVAIFRVKEQ